MSDCCRVAKCHILICLGLPLRHAGEKNKSIPQFVRNTHTNEQGRNKWVDRVAGAPNRNDPPKTPQKNNPIGLGLLTVSCPWDPEGLATPVLMKEGRKYFI